MPFATIMRSGRSGCTRTRWMSRSCGSGSTGNSVNVSPKSIDTDSVPISTPTSSRSPSSTMSLTWPMRGGGGKNHLSTLGVLRNRGELAPALAFVLADVDVRRQRADQNHVAALQFAAARRPDIEMCEAFVAPGPGHAAVVAPRDADAVGRGEQRAVIERGHRADEQPASARCLMAQPSASFASTATPSTVPTTMRVGALCARWMLLPPLEIRIIVPLSYCTAKPGSAVTSYRRTRRAGYARRGAAQALAFPCPPTAIRSQESGRGGARQLIQGGSPSENRIPCSSRWPRWPVCC